MEGEQIDPAPPEASDAATTPAPKVIDAAAPSAPDEDVDLDGGAPPFEPLIPPGPARERSAAKPKRAEPRDPAKLKKKTQQRAVQRLRKKISVAEADELPELLAELRELTGIAPAAAPLSPPIIAASPQPAPAAAPQTAPAATQPVPVPPPVNPPKAQPTAEEIAEFSEPCAKFWALFSKVMLKVDPLAKEEIEALGDAWAPIAAKYAKPLVDSPWLVALGTTSMILGPRVLRAIDGPPPGPKMRAVS